MAFLGWWATILMNFVFQNAGIKKSSMTKGNCAVLRGLVFGFRNSVPSLIRTANTAPTAKKQAPAFESGLELLCTVYAGKGLGHILSEDW
jgi:hypothetical protein